MHDLASITTNGHDAALPARAQGPSPCGGNITGAADSTLDAHVGTGQAAATARLKVLSVLTALTTAGSLALGGCASTPAPLEQMAVADAAVKRANNASTVESAPAELAVAVAKLNSARDAQNAKDYERARRLAEQAEVDAQVAEVRAQSVRQRKAAQESQDAARALREEIGRKAPQ
jgi:hypothetical protein